MDDDGEQDHEAGDGEEPFAPLDSREYGQQDEQQRAQPSGTSEPGDDAPVARVDLLPGQHRQQHQGPHRQRQHGEQDRPAVRHAEAAPDEPRPERHEGEQQEHLGGGLAEVEKAVA